MSFPLQQTHLRMSIPGSGRFTCNHHLPIFRMPYLPVGCITNIRSSWASHEYPVKLININLYSTCEFHFIYIYIYIIYIYIYYIYIYTHIHTHTVYIGIPFMSKCRFSDGQWLDFQWFSSSSCSDRLVQRSREKLGKFLEAMVECQKYHI